MSFEFDKVIRLYKAVGGPQLEGQGSSFAFSGPKTRELAEAISDARSLPDKFGYFLEEEDEDDNVTIRWLLAEASTWRIYFDVPDFVARTPSLNRGEMPSDYYIASIDYRAGNAITDLQLQKVQSCCELIKLLAALSGHPLADIVVAGAAVMTFTAPADVGKPPKTIRLTTYVSPNILSLPEPDLTALDGVLSNDVKYQLHIEERKSLFRISVAEVLREGGQGREAFERLIKSWPDVLTKYRNDLDCFVYGYSFDKLRRDIATAELDYTTRLGNVLKDFSGKLYGLPISFAAIIPLATPKTLMEVLLIIAGMVLLSLILSSVVWNQRIEMKRIENSYSTVFGQFNKELTEYPQDLQTALANAIRGIEKQRKLLSRTLIISYGLSWIPPIAGIAVMSSAGIVY